MRTDRSRASGSTWIVSCFLGSVVLGFGAVSGARADETSEPASDSRSGHGLSGDWRGLRTRLADHGLVFEVAYTGDTIGTTAGGLGTGTVYLGNLDMTLTLHTWELMDWDLGTFFAYGLVDHGGKPSTLVGDAQVTDNIEAPTAAKLLELWWQRAFLDLRLPVLPGLYDVNSEFYVVDSAELFRNSSFGIGPELALSGRNGPSILLDTSLAVRLEAEPIRGYTITAAVMDGDPGGGAGTHIHLREGDGVFFIAQVSRHWSREEEDEEDDLRGPGPEPTRRRRVGRTIDQSPDYLRLTVGTWMYSAPRTDLGASAVTGRMVTKTIHPGLYVLAEFDATVLSRLDARGLSAFLQLGFGDGDASHFVGYKGAGSCTGA